MAVCQAVGVEGANALALPPRIESAALDKNVVVCHLSHVASGMLVES